MSVTPHWRYRKCKKANQRFNSRMASLDAAPEDNHQALMAGYLDSASSILFESLYCLQRRFCWSCMFGLICFCMCRCNNVSNAGGKCAPGFPWGPLGHHCHRRFERHSCWLAHCLPSLEENPMWNDVIIC
jgi:hypothetical protein